ncbi:MAG: hypothetical protein KAZ87_12070 [Spirochaetes bacterium]|nr:hypothetical protein [Spirochaetota bacterium]
MNSVFSSANGYIPGQKITGRILSRSKESVLVQVGKDVVEAKISGELRPGKLSLEYVGSENKRPVFRIADGAFFKELFSDSSGASVFLRSIRAGMSVFLSAMRAKERTDYSSPKKDFLRSCASALISKNFTPSEVSFISRIFVSDERSAMFDIFFENSLIPSEEVIRDAADEILEQYTKYELDSKSPDDDFFYIEDEGKLFEYDSFSDRGFYFAEFELSRSGKIDIIAKLSAERIEICVIAVNKTFLSGIKSLLPEIYENIQKKIEKGLIIRLFNYEEFVSEIENNCSGAFLDTKA